MQRIISQISKSSEVTWTDYYLKHVVIVRDFVNERVPVLGSGTLHPVRLHGRVQLTPPGSVIHVGFLQIHEPIFVVQHLPRRPFTVPVDRVHPTSKNAAFSFENQYQGQKEEVLLTIVNQVVWTSVCGSSKKWSSSQPHNKKLIRPGFYTIGFNRLRMAASST